MTKDATIPDAAVLAALEIILANTIFIKAPRMSRLLGYLVKKAITGSVRDTNEYVIGIEVFDRDASTYNPSEDPIVRVQVGRLREKLKAYYATVGADSDIEISIPVGRYMPIIQRLNSVNTDFKQGSMLAMYPFKSISYHGDGMPFTQGLNEELMHQLFKEFGKIRVAHPFLTPGDADSASWSLKSTCSAEANHLIEGSVRIDAERIRTSIRLIDISVGCIAWSEQFDRNIFFATTVQEEIALSICTALKGYLSQE